MNARLRTPTSLVWHILKKDWNVLKALVIGTAAVQALLALVMFRPEPVAATQGLQGIAALLSLCLAISVTLLIVLSVHQEAIPGANQDWLVRPIPRRDLLLAKILFVLLMVHGPIIAVNVVSAAGEGFEFGSALRAVLLSNLQSASLFTLPIMAIAAMTRTVTEAFVGLLGVIVALVLTFLISTYVFQIHRPTSDTGIGWVWGFFGHTLFVVVTLAVLTRQYLRRSTESSRIIFVAGAMLTILASGLPWQPAFAIQKWLSRTPDVDHAASITFDPTIRSSTDNGQSIARPFLNAAGEKSSKAEVDSQSVRVLMPLRLSELAVGDILHTDRTLVRILDAAGITVYRGSAQTMDVRSSNFGAAPIALRQILDIPLDVYENVADENVKLEVEYSLTLLQPRKVPSFSALSGHGGMLAMVQCASRGNPELNGIDVNCRSVGESPPCISMTLEQQGRGEMEPEIFRCNLNYEPAVLRFSMAPIEEFEVKLPFRDPSGLAHYPLDAEYIRAAQVVITVYEAYAHVSRHLTKSEVRLRNWTAADARQPIAASHASGATHLLMSKRRP